MTTDTTALQKRIRRARSVPAEWARLREGESTREQIERHQRRMDEQVAALVDAEVRAAKIEAWQEGVNFALPNAETTWYPQHNPYRVTEYETGDQA